MGAKRSRWKISRLPAASGFFGGTLADVLGIIGNAIDAATGG